MIGHVIEKAFHPAYRCECCGDGCDCGCVEACPSHKPTCANCKHRNPCRDALEAGAMQPLNCVQRDKWEPSVSEPAND